MQYADEEGHHLALPIFIILFMCGMWRIHA
jgi:hypothetical protein